jgi:hypothetical protein
MSRLFLRCPLSSRTLIIPDIENEKAEPLRKQSGSARTIVDFAGSTPGAMANGMTAKMDSFAKWSYVHIMLTRAFSLLALLAIVVVTTLAPAHAARMSAASDHETHAEMMMHAAAVDAESCHDQQACSDADAASCEVVCAGLTVFPALQNGEDEQDVAPFRHDTTSGTFFAGLSPGLNERPPKSRLF